MEIPEVSTLPKTPGQKPRGKFWLWLLVVLVVVGCVVYVWYLKKHKSTSNTPANVVPQTVNQARMALGVKRTEVDFTQIPEGIPQDYPAEASSKIIQNYIAVADSGNKQAVREYETVKSLSDNVKLFKDYFSKTKWQVTADVDTDTKLHVINAIKDKTYFTVSIGESALTKKQTIKLLITQF